MIKFAHTSNRVEFVYSLKTRRSFQSCKRNVQRLDRDLLYQELLHLNHVTFLHTSARLHDVSLRTLRRKSVCFFEVSLVRFLAQAGLSVKILGSSSFTVSQCVNFELILVSSLLCLPLCQLICMMLDWSLCKFLASPVRFVWFQGTLYFNFSVLAFEESYSLVFWPCQSCFSPVKTLLFLLSLQFASIIINQLVRLLCRLTTQSNRPFPSSKNSHYQNEAICQLFCVTIGFICMKIKNYFHINIALQLASL